MAATINAPRSNEVFTWSNSVVDAAAASRSMYLRVLIVSATPERGGLEKKLKGKIVSTLSIQLCGTTLGGIM